MTLTSSGARWRVGDRVRLVEPIGLLKAGEIGLMIAPDDTGKFAGTVAFPALRENRPAEQGGWVDGIEVATMPNPDAIPVAADEIVYIDNMLDGDNCKGVEVE